MEVSEKLSKWLNNLRRNNSDLAYIGVPELHLSGRYHFHFLMSGLWDINLIDSCKKDKKGRVIYNLGKYGLGWSTATEITDTMKASNYLTQYITETLGETTKGKKRYWASRNLNLPVENELLLDSFGIDELKKSIKKITTYRKVVKIDTPDFKNEIEYIETYRDYNTKTKN